MTVSRNSSRQRLIHAALALFASQGVTETTTREIAELAEVNEVTLFRQFGNKHGLLLAVIEEAAVFTQLGQALVQQANHSGNIYQALKDYANACLQALESVPAVVRSVVGEAGQYPSENREALGRGFTQANHYVAEYFATVIHQGQLQTYLPPEKLASLLNGMLLGYAVIEFTSEFHELWQNREDFLENLVTLFLHGAVAQAAEDAAEVGTVGGSLVRLEVPVATVADLPANLVHAILVQAKKAGLEDYAIAYILFGAGLSPDEVIRLERSHHLSAPHQQLLQITQGAIRQVPINQWILGKRYGSYTKNPLTQWLKSRKDTHSAMFLNASGNPLSVAELQQRWQTLTDEVLTPEGTPPSLEQAQQTWCIEMLMRGIALADLCLFTGWNTDKLQPYAQRAREKAALEQAMRLDQKTQS